MSTRSVCRSPAARFLVAFPCCFSPTRLQCWIDVLSLPFQCNYFIPPSPISLSPPFSARFCFLLLLSCRAFPCRLSPKLPCWRCSCSGIKSSFASVPMRLLHPFLADSIVAPFCRAFFCRSPVASPCLLFVSLVASLCSLLNRHSDACRFQFPCSSSPACLLQVLLMLNEKVLTPWQYYLYLPYYQCYAQWSSG